jgi:two-component system, chemotaxis family, CheB/CheR fusion protein
VRAQAGATANLRPTAIVGMGASAGGLPAFQALLRALPPDTGLAYVVLSHLVPDYTSMLAEILSRWSWRITST